MSTRKKPKNLIQRLVRRSWRLLDTFVKAVANWVLRSLMVHKRRSRLKQQAGFVLPTVVMVLLVVVLLTTAIVIRSFDRTKNASNFRVDQAVLNAATPALDRARAKIERLFSPDENRLAGQTPPEGVSAPTQRPDPGTISDVLSQAQYTFGDETQLKLAYTRQGAGDATDPATQTLNTAWKFAVDTDNNGKFDTYTLYGSYFRNPPLDASNNPKRARTPLEARALPQAIGGIDVCSSGSDDSTQQGWYKTDGQLKKAFFVYVANVPISQTDITKVPAANQPKYEPYKGNKGFSALEMQQDQARISLDNNAVWYDDDLVIYNVPTFRVNGRIHTNSNLMAANTISPDPIIFYQVSSLDSCYYLPENGKISVGGNIAAGDIRETTPAANTKVQVHLFQQAKLGTGTQPDTANVKNINNLTETTTLSPQEVASNINAYNQRLNTLVSGAIYLFKQANTQYPNLTNWEQAVSNFTRFPDEIATNFKAKFDPDDPSSGANILTQVLTSYYANRIRRVSYKEIAYGANPLISSGSAVTYLTVFPGGTKLEPPQDWMRLGTSQLDSTYSKVPLKVAGSTLQPETSNPTDIGVGEAQREGNIGDRVLVGHGVPTRWVESAPGATPVTYADKREPQKLENPQINWNSASGGTRERRSRVEQLDDLGDTSRGGFWEQAAAFTGSAAKQYPELAGGLRVVTGAGIYIDGNEPTLNVGTGKRVGEDPGAPPTSIRSFLPAPPTAAELKLMATTDQNGIKLPLEIMNATPTQLQNDYKVVWPDTMPMFNWTDSNGDGQYTLAGGEVKRGDLQMRATVVYHYQDRNTAKTQGVQQPPIACIATFYDPTSPDTAQNFKGFTQIDDQKLTDFGASINGINYDASALAGLRASANNTVLRRQANMIFPNGRWVNKPLKDALKKLTDNGGDVSKLGLNDIAAIDAAHCALTIVYGASPTSGTLVPDGAIQERTFLDGRQIKAIHKRNTKADGTLLTRLVGTPPAATFIDRETKLQDVTDPAKVKIAELGSLTSPDPISPGTPTSPNLLPPEYSLPIEQRQPLEIRVTQIDLSKLRNKTIGTGSGTGIANDQEYMLPNSGIIYASRDDALPDISDFNFATDQDGGASATDFKLDPTRRPNGIRLVKGETLARDDNTNAYRTVEKGLILASDLPVYVKGSFNLHHKPKAPSEVREEFKGSDLLRDDYSNFYTRSKGNKNQSFACRPNPNNPGACPDLGDQWRPARILSDAVTLLSKNFRDGYRNEGDFDLNNNIGNLAVESRLKNGFWWNDFATTAQWYGADGFPDVDKTTPATKELSSYLTNAVTPVQRRVPLAQGGFPQYLMEACTKRPISACGPQDWLIGKDSTNAEKRIADLPVNTTTNLDTLLPPTGATAAKARAGTTAQPSTGELIVSPRRVAFRRDSYGALIPNPLDCNPNATPPVPCKAVPIGVNSTTTVDVPYSATPPFPLTPADNALWYWTIPGTDPTNPSPVAPSYNNTSNLYYRPFDSEAVSEKQFLLPGMPDFPSVMGIPALNTGTSALDLPDLAVFMVNVTANICRVSNTYLALAAGNVATINTCSTTAPTLASAGTALNGLWTGLRNPAFRAANNNNTAGVMYVEDSRQIPVPTDFTPAGASNISLLAKAKVNIYTIANPTAASPNAVVLSNTNITLDRNGQDNPIFVLRTEQNMDFQAPVKITLKGVDPNNVFWVTGQGVRIVKNDNHKLVGNFIGNSGSAFLITDGVNIDPGNPQAANAPLMIQGGRILGFGVTPGSLPASAMTAMTTTDQPLLVPVLQLHSPQGAPASNNATVFGGRSITEQYWIQHVTQSSGGETFNAVFIMGDSPSRPLNNTVTPGESSGGLGNFPRFLEAWEDEGPERGGDEAPAIVKGSFIQFKKSIFATAPFEAVDDPTKDNSLFFDSAAVGSVPDYMSNYTLATDAPQKPYIYKGGGAIGRAPSYRPPERRWGYDVALLTQTPDLFSRRFASPSAGTPNEYFREVGRDDAWVQTLLCAAQKPATGTAYERAIADPKQVPTSCPSLATYADPSAS